MTNRKLFIPVISLLIVGIVLGSIFDLQISQAIYSDRNIVGVFFTSISAFPAYAGIVIASSYVLFYSNKYFKNIWLKIFFIFAAICLISFYIYATYGDFVDKHGWNFTPILKYVVGISVVALSLCGFFYFGYYLFKQNQSFEAFKVACAIAFIIMASFAVVFFIKPIMCRPRFRWLESLGLENVEFRNWWQRNKDKDTLMTLYNAPSSEFKSFPSGHGMNSACTMITLSYLPLIDKRLMKKQSLLFLIGFVFNLIVCFSRIILGAHFLSDVCFGALITMIVFYICNEIFIHYIQKEKEKIKE